MDARASLLVLLVACTEGVDTPQRIVCHNGNCGASAADFGADDSLPALAESLELGPTMLDGAELDFSWDVDHCVFGHGGDKPAADPALAVAMVEDYLAAHGGQTPSGEPFIAYLEMKRTDHVAELADCIAGVARGLTGTEIYLSSGSTELLRAARERVGTGAFYVAEGPGCLDADPDLISLSVIKTKDDQLAAYDSLGIEIALWADLDLPSVFGTLDIHPRFISVPNIAAVREFLDR